MRFFVSIFIILFFFSCEDNIHKKEIDFLAREISTTLTNQMKTEALIEQMLMLYVPLSIDSKIQELKPGGIFIFRSNIPDKNGKQDIQELKNRIQKINNWYIENKIPPPFYSIDQENGHVKRIINHNIMFPSQMAVWEATANRNKNYIKQMAYYTCKSLKNIGISWNLAPVIDLVNNIDNPVIRTRGFTANAHDVILAGEYYLEGLHLAGCIDAIKHFPGHGDTSQDSHKTLPIIKKDRSSFEENDLYAFQYLITHNKNYALMPGHLRVPYYDDLPASLSSKWLNELVRKKWKFNGLIVSDDLSMSAVSVNKNNKTFQNLAVQSVQAGVDVLLLFSQSRLFAKDLKIGLMKAVKEKIISKSRLKKSVQRILYYKIKIGLLNDYLQNSKIKIQFTSKIQKRISRFILLYKKRQKQVQNIAMSFRSKQDVNQYLSKHSIKLLKEGNFFDIKNKVVFTDLKKSNHQYKKLKKISKKIYSIKELSEITLEEMNEKVKQKQIVILNVNIKKFKSYFKDIREKFLDYNFIIYTNINPFPYSSFGEYLKKNDSLIVSFSDTECSTNALIDSLLSNTIPNKSIIKYSRSR